MPPAPATLPATSQPTSAGLAIRLAGSASAYSEIAGVSELPITSSPTWNAVTPVPTWSTTPATSDPSPAGRSRGIISRMKPCMIFESIGLTPAARTAMRTCPGPALGAGASTTRSTSVPPYSEN